MVHHFDGVDGNEGHFALAKSSVTHCRRDDTFVQGDDLEYHHYGARVMQQAKVDYGVDEVDLQHVREGSGDRNTLEDHVPPTVDCDEPAGSQSPSHLDKRKGRQVARFWASVVP